jgi:chromosome segregation ATPase
MITLAELKNDLAVNEKELYKLNQDLERLQADLNNFELDPDSYEDQYCEMLDDLYSEVCNALPISISASRLILEFDPTMYRCGLNDYIDSLDVSDDQAYQDLEAEISELEDQIGNLEEEISDLEDEIEQLENDSE